VARKRWLFGNSWTIRWTIQDGLVTPRHLAFIDAIILSRTFNLPLQEVKLIIAWTRMEMEKLSYELGTKIKRRIWVRALPMKFWISTINISTSKDRTELSLVNPNSLLIHQQVKWWTGVIKGISLDELRLK
jgi:hypothetical protein